MTIKQFIFSQLSPSGQEPSIAKFITRFSDDKNFPDTDNVRTVAEYLYPKLDQDSTSAFQKLLMIWMMQSGGTPNPSILNDLNHMVVYQIIT